VNAFKAINDKHGHSAGDAVISHLAALLQLNTRRGDWVARWGADEFVVGLHRNRALKMVMERVIKAIASSPCEIAPGLELRISVSCGVADYRFGSAVAGVLADAEKALYSAKVLARTDTQSHIAYRNEISEVPAPEQAAAD
jgi:diguanylate cyclase (GGDEF)-like protein